MAQVQPVRAIVVDSATSIPLIGANVALREGTLARADSAAGVFRPGPGSGRAGGLVQVYPVTRYDISMVPEYLPAFSGGWRRVIADADNIVWIRSRRPDVPAYLEVYDVVNREGRLIDRIQLPDGKELAGFGPGGVVFMIARDGGRQILERASWR